MSAGPLRRIVAALGLVALAPIAAMLVTGAISPEEAAFRAVVVGVVTVLLGRIAQRIVTSLLRRVERRAEDREDGAVPSVASVAGR